MEEEELKLWNYLRKKLSVLKDNNKTAREIFEYIYRKRGYMEGLRAGEGMYHDTTDEVLDELCSKNDVVNLRYKQFMQDKLTRQLDCYSSQGFLSKLKE